MTSNLPKIVQDFDNLYDTGIDHGPAGFVRVMSIEYEQDNMKELCKMIIQFDNSNDVFDRMGHLFEFSVVEVVDTAFKLLDKFPNNPYLQAQCVCLIRHVVCDNDVYIPDEHVKKHVNTIVEAIRIVNTCITLDDDFCENVQDVLNGFTDNSITILYKLGAKDKIDGVDLSNLTELYNKHVKDDKELNEIYKELF